MVVVGGGEDESMASGGKNSVSRIDKWKAKHEAMLKLAEGKHANPAAAANGDKNNEGNNVGAVHDEDEDEEDIEVGGGGGAGGEEKKKSLVKSPEIPDIDPEDGVMIDLNEKPEAGGPGMTSAQQSSMVIAAAASMHARNGDVRVQQALSV